jgi:hypothetical protein
LIGCFFDRSIDLWTPDLGAAGRVDVVDARVEVGAGAARADLRARARRRVSNLPAILSNLSSNLS